MATTKEEKDSLFKDLGYLKTSQFKMTTSNISPASNYYGGFGAPLNGYGIAYWIKKDTIGFSISGNGRDVYEFRRCLERTLTDVMILFPKRSSVWGMDWKRKHEDEAIAERNLKQMKVASDLYLERRNSLIEKYRK